MLAKLQPAEAEKKGCSIYVTRQDLAEIEKNLAAAGTSVATLFGADPVEIEGWFAEDLEKNNVSLLKVVLSATKMGPNLLSYLVEAANSMSDIATFEVFDLPAQEKEASESVLIAAHFVGQWLRDLPSCQFAGSMFRETLKALDAL